MNVGLVSSSKNRAPLDVIRSARRTFHKVDQRLAIGISLLVSMLGVISPVPPASANTGLMDSSFGRDGAMITPAPWTTWNGSVHSLAEDATGRLIAVGPGYENSFGVLRYFSDGSLDLSFTNRSFAEHDTLAPGGLVLTRFGEGAVAHDVTVQEDGNIVVAGFSRAGLHRRSYAFALVRYSEDGRLDPTFGKNGRVLTPMGKVGGGAFSLAIQRDGKILVAGIRMRESKYTEGVLIRYLPNGRIDRGFGSQGRVRFVSRAQGKASLRDVAVLPNNRILVAGGLRGNIMLAQFLPDGRLDRGFGGGDGLVLSDVDGHSFCVIGQCSYADSLSVRHGRITVAGNVTTEHKSFAVLARYRANGQVDRSFGDKGVVRVRHGNSFTSEQLVLRHDGRIVVAGYFYGRLSKGGISKIGVFQFLRNGMPDGRFGDQGFFTRRIGYASTGFAGLAQRDGRVVVGGGSSLRASMLEGGGPYPAELAHFTLLRFR